MSKDKDLHLAEDNIALMEEQSADLLELRYLNKGNAEFNRTPGGFVSLKYKEVFYERVGVFRTFPFSDPDHFISIREANDKAREIGIIKDLKKDLTKEAYEMILEQLELRYFTPVIKKINDIKEEYGFAYFDVTTNFGDCKFAIHMNSGAVVTLSENRILIKDLDGNRFEIPDLHKLSVGELKKLDLFI